MNEQEQTLVSLDEDLNATLGFVLDEMEDHRVTGHFEVENRVRQPFGIVHGGAYASIAETLASVGTYRAVAGQDKIAMGMSNDTTFLRSVSSGRVDAVAEAIHTGSTTWVWEVKLSDDQGRLCAVSRLTIAVRERR